MELPDQIMQYNDEPPPLPPPKSVKKKFLRAPLAAIKNAILKSTRPLRRQNSLIEHRDRARSSHLRRQHSMMEHHTSGWGMRSPEFMMHAQQQQRYYAQDQRSNYPRHEQYYPEDRDRNYNYGYDERNYSANSGSNFNRSASSQYNEENLYANRAFIELERQSMAAQHAGPSAAIEEGAARVPGGRIVRRHSMADRSLNRDSPMFVPRGSSQRERSVPRDASRISDGSSLNVSQRGEEIYQTRSGAFLMNEQRVPRAAHRTRDEEAIYQSRREMHLDHLYQSKKEMIQKIQMGRMEVERAASSESPSIPSSSAATTPTVGDGASPVREIYTSRKELKERGFKTRTQLRDHIYQTRREAMESMAEPIYVSSKQRQEAIIYEAREPESIAAPIAELSEINSMPMPTIPAPILKSSTVFANQNSRNSSGSVDITNEDETVLVTNQSDIQKTVTDPSRAAETGASDNTELSIMPLSPRADRSHISNIIKRIAPPTSNSDDESGSSIGHIHASRTSMETHYTSSIISLPTGPPGAHSTPYASEAALDPPGVGGPNQFLPLREPTTNRGTFDSNGGILSDSVWKVSIDIPPGAIPPGTQQEIYFTVTDPRCQTVGGPPLDMENGWSLFYKHFLFCSVIFFF